MISPDLTHVLGGIPGQACTFLGGLTVPGLPVQRDGTTDRIVIRICTVHIDGKDRMHLA